MSIIKKIFYGIYMIVSVVIFFMSFMDYEMMLSIDPIIYVFVIIGAVLAFVWTFIFLLNGVPRISRQIGVLVRSIGQSDVSDFKFDKDYFNEILEIHSPLILGCLDNFNLDKNKLIATLLYLERKGVIKIENDRIENTGDENLSFGDPCSMLLGRLNDGKIKIYDSYEFIDSVRYYTLVEAQNIGLVVKNEDEDKYKYGYEENSMKKLLRSFITTIAIYIIAIMYLKSLETTTWFSACIMIFLILYLPLKILIKAAYQSGKKGHQYVRTKEGQELNNKLDGLKKYLNDYSNMSERNAEEIELWEDYLIYSVMFGQNKKVVKEYEKYIIIE